MNAIVNYGFPPVPVLNATPGEQYEVTVVAEGIGGNGLPSTPITTVVCKCCVLMSRNV